MPHTRAHPLHHILPGGCGPPCNNFKMQASFSAGSYDFHPDPPLTGAISLFDHLLLSFLPDPPPLNMPVLPILVHSFSSSKIECGASFFATLLRERLGPTGGSDVRRQQKSYFLECSPPLPPPRGVSRKSYWATLPMWMCVVNWEAVLQGCAGACGHSGEGQPSPEVNIGYLLSSCVQRWVFVKRVLTIRWWC